MHLNTLKRYAKKASKQVATTENLDLASKRLTGSVKAMQKIMVLEPYDSLSSLQNVFKKWGKL